MDQTAFRKPPDSSDHAEKPCVTCRRRKVKCSKTLPCSNCSRSKTDCYYDEQDQPEGIALSSNATGDLLGRLSRLEDVISSLSQRQNSLPSTTIQSSDPISFPSAAPRLPQEFPNLRQSEILVNIFLNVVEPLIWALNVTRFQEELRQFRAGAHVHPKDFNALLSCVHAVSISSFSADFALDLFGSPRTSFLISLGQAAETALHAADFMRSSSITVFQALLYYISFLFEANEYEAAHSMTGIALQVSKRLTSSRPEILDQRRIWSHLHHLDMMGRQLTSGPSIHSLISNPRFRATEADRPWNGLWNLSGYPSLLAIAGFSFPCLISARDEIDELEGAVTEKVTRSVLPCEDLTLQIQQTRDRVEQQYLAHADTDQLVQVFEAEFLRIRLQHIDIMATTSHVLQAKAETSRLPLDQSLVLLQSISQLETAPEFTRWRWHLKSWIPWFAAAVLAESNLALFGDEEKVQTARNELNALHARHGSKILASTHEDVLAPPDHLRRTGHVS